MKTLRDIKLMFLRNVQHTLKTPVFILVSLLQPILYLVLFMPLLKNLGGVPGLPQGQTVEVFIPGLLVMLSFFSSAFVGFSLIDDIKSGVLERFLVTPVSRQAILFGRVLRDAAVLIVQCILITVIALFLGLHVNIIGFLLALILYALVAITMASMSYSFALIYRTEDNLAPTVNTITLPLSLLSGILLPLALAPLWLQDLAKVNPLSHVVNASRALFAGNFQNTDIITGFVSIFLLSVVVFWWSTRSLRRIV